MYSNTCSSSTHKNCKTYIPWDNIIADDKNEAEGGPREIKICLGCGLDAGQLLVRLLLCKYKDWDVQIDKPAKQKSASEEELASVLRWLENVDITVTMLGYFLSNICHLQIRAKQKKHSALLNKRAKDDLIFTKSFLSRAKDKISINLVMFREPKIVHICDAL